MSAIITRHSGAAVLVAAIRAAALEVPEVRPELEFPDRYAPGRYLFTVPAELETGADVYMACAGGSVDIDAPACKWPRLNVHPESMGPFLPILTPARVSFAYSTPDGARGSLTVANNRPALLALADKVHKARAAFDDKPRRAAKPSKTPASSAPHVAARAMWQEQDYAGALTLAQARGAVFFGMSPTPGAFPYMDAESVDAAGHGFTIARAILTGKFRVLHTASALAADTVRAGAPSDLGFSTYTAALDWFETRVADDDFRVKLDAGARAAAPFDQSAALAHYMGDDAAPADETEAQRDESAPADAMAPESAPDAPTGRESAPAACIVARVVVESPALQATAAHRHQSDAWRRVHWAQSKTRELARELRDSPAAAWQSAAWQSVGFEFSARGALRSADAQAWRDATARAVRAGRRLERDPSVRIVSPAEFALTVAQLQMRRAAAWMRRACMLDAPDSGRAAAIAQARGGELAAAPAVLAHLRRIAEHGRTADLRTDAEETARALADALAELARETTPPTALSDTPTALSEPCAAVPPTALSEAREVSALEFATTVLRARVRASAELAHRLKRTTGGGAWVLRAIAGDLTIAVPVAAALRELARNKRRDLPTRDEARSEADALDCDYADYLRELAASAPPTPHSQSTPDAAFPDDGAAEWEQALAEAQARRALAAELAASAESVQFTCTGDATRYGIAGPDMSGVDAFRFTYFDARGPVGHAGAVSLAAACDDALQRGYAPIPTAQSNTEARPCVAIWSDASHDITRARAAYLIRAARSRGQVCSVRRVGLHSFAIDGARLRIVTGGRPALPTAQPACKHPPARLYSGHAMHADGATRLWVACCACGDVLTPTPDVAFPDAPEPIPCGEAIELDTETIEAAAPPTTQPAAPLIAIRDLLPGVLAHVHSAARTVPRAPLRLPPMDPRRRIPGTFRPSYVLAARGGAL